MIKEIPILFSTAMVLALLEGRKTQTRRLKGLEYIPTEGINYARCENGEDQTFKCNPGLHAFFGNSETDTWYTPIKCPYGNEGDIFYVREEHYRYGAWVEKEGEYTKGGRQKWMFVAHTDELLFKAPAELRKGRHHKDPYTPTWHKRLARFMPKSAARIWLQKTNTKVERACDISHDDAIAEGLACLSKDGGRVYKYGIPDSDGLPGNDDFGWHWQDWHVDPVEAFKKLWAQVNGLDTWDSWVWCNSFKVLSTTGKPDLQNLKAIG